MAPRLFPNPPPNSAAAPIRPSSKCVPCAPTEPPRHPPVGGQPIGPAPLASDATGNGTQDYHQLAGRATAVAASTTSVAYNASAGLFFAAIRYHGVYSSPDGVTWTPSTVNLVAVFSAVTSGQTTGPTV